MKSSSKVLAFDYQGLTKIISGGQVGADLGALHAAKELQCPTGGWAPRGWRTQNGPFPVLAEFGLVEHFRPEYRFRTELNIADSGGTLIVAANLSSPGTALTISCCNKLSKPMYVIRPSEVSAQSVTRVCEWIKADNIRVLNVAGNRDKSPSNLHYEASFNLVSSIILMLGLNKTDA